MFKAFEYHKNSNGGWLKVRQGSNLDYSAQSSYEFRVAVYDSKDEEGNPETTDGHATADRSWVDAYFEITIHVADPDYVTWDIGEDVSVTDRQTAEEAADIIHDYLIALQLPESSNVTFHLYEDIEAMSQAFSGTSGQWDSDSVSASRGWEPYVYTGNRWVKASSQNLSTIVAKEIAGKLTDNLSSVSTNLLPAWYRAGSSWFLARAALGETGVINYDDERWSDWVPNSRRVDRPLRTCLRSLKYVKLRLLSGEG